MIQLAYYVLPAAAIAAFITSVALHSPRRVGIKVVCIAGLTALLPLTLLGFADLLGRPKPVALEQALSAGPDATVVAATMEEGEAIWLWIAYEAGPEPRAFALPWSLDLARQLRKAQSESERQGVKVKMRMARLKKNSDDQTEPVFYPAPTPPLPDKIADAG